MVWIDCGEGLGGGSMSEEERKRERKKIVSGMLKVKLVDYVMDLEEGKKRGKEAIAKLQEKIEGLERELERIKKDRNGLSLDRERIEGKMMAYSNTINELLDRIFDKIGAQEDGD